MSVRRMLNLNCVADSPRCSSLCDRSSRKRARRALASLALRSARRHCACSRDRARSRSISRRKPGSASMRRSRRSIGMRQNYGIPGRSHRRPLRASSSTRQLFLTQVKTPLRWYWLSLRNDSLPPPRRVCTGRGCGHGVASDRFTSG